MAEERLAFELRNALQKVKTGKAPVNGGNIFSYKTQRIQDPSNKAPTNSNGEFFKQ